MAFTNKTLGHVWVGSRTASLLVCGVFILVTTHLSATETAGVMPAPVHTRITVSLHSGVAHRRGRRGKRWDERNNKRYLERGRIVKIVERPHLPWTDSLGSTCETKSTQPSSAPQGPLPIWFLPPTLPADLLGIPRHALN